MKGESGDCSLTRPYHHRVRGTGKAGRLHRLKKSPVFQCDSCIARARLLHLLRPPRL